mmetsp:Transcript_41890/g.67351  ORF Transcript_41890/g.67351 Transcript_41890/m.67351 type:complete len:94 (-) Transcript_41890:256-537(-)|eukprot:CAMPEP_0197027326 /NCGR_PEP_ID=MMETSP1384-20130603/7260_1 /TAXON_ID=29189 /ORGANISM="Ammonia sp." /LENGTH=93 /DNA_ID=CAMNT_0042456157 /DNA_START=19 /DNA_END=300 /DNA_ORIENTATION=+
MAEMKKAVDEYTIECKDCQLDQTVITSDDIKKKQFSTSYSKDKFSKPGSLNVSNWELDKDEKLVGVTFEVVQPAKDDKGNVDPTDNYKATVKG